MNAKRVAIRLSLGLCALVLAMLCSQRAISGGTLEPAAAGSAAISSADTWPPVTAVQPLAPFTRGQAVLVSWGGRDPGLSGIQHYDVQFRDAAVGAWTDLLMQTGATSTTFSGALGHTYHFRVRGVDAAGNVEPWPAGKGDTQTAFYLWALRGTVWDNGGAPVQGAAVTTSPPAFAPAASGADGEYGAYVDGPAGTYAVGVAKAGYGILPTTVLTGVEDAQMDLVLPPADNVVLNWGFEEGSLGPSWQTSGPAPAVLTTTLRHTGAQAVVLGQPRPAFTAPTNISNSPATKQHWINLIPDGTGGVHMLWRHGEPGTGAPVYYARRAGDGTWIVPPAEVPRPGASSWTVLALGPDGAVHIVGQQFVGDEWHIMYAERPPEGPWSDLILLNAGQPMPALEGVPQIAVGADNGVHVVWNNSGNPLYPSYQRIFWTGRDASGAWSEPLDISLPPLWSTYQPGVAAEQLGGVHVTWLESQGRQMYACRAATGPWSRPIILGGVNAGPAALSVEADGTIHALWGDPSYSQGSCRGAWSTPELVPDAFANVATNLVVDSAGTVHLLAWFAGGEMRYAHRPWGGSWSTPQTLVGVTDYAGAPALAVDDTGTAHLLWRGGIDGWGPGTIHLFHTYRKADLTWSWPENISGVTQWLGLESAVPDVLALEGNGRVHAGWSDGDSPAMDVYYTSSALAQQTGNSTLSQTIAVPALSTHPMLSYLYQLGGASPGSGNWFGAAVRDGTVTTTLSSETQSTGWTHRWFDLEPWAGQTVTLTFTLHQVAGEQPAWACLDEVTVGSAHPDVWVGQSGLPAAVPGQQIVDAITYGNRGGIDAANGQVTLGLPPELTFVSADPPPSELPPNLRWDVGDLAAHSPAHTITATLQVAPSVLAGATLAAAAAISAEPAELEQHNNAGQMAVTVEARGHLPLIARLWSTGCLLEGDDFSDPDSGWPVGDYGDYALGYLNGEYRFLLRSGATRWVYVQGDWGASDFRVEVDARPAAHANGAVGLVFGLIEEGRGWYLYAVHDGQFGLWRYTYPRTWTTLIHWTPSTAIRPGAGSNRLAVDRRGERIVLYANGQIVGAASDGTYLGSGLGMWGEVFASGFDGRFDNFSVYAALCPEAGAAAGSAEMSVEAGR